MLFSIIIPVYNVEKYLRECLDSVLVQNIADYEVILVDDGSTDTSGIICDEYAEKFMQIQVIHQKNAGVAVARNRGLKCASGNYIIFIDSDDYILRIDFLTLLREKCIVGYDVIFYGYQKYFENTGKFGIEIYNYPELNDHMTKSEVALCLLQAEMYEGSAWTKAIRRDFLQTNFIEFISGMISEDSEWFLQVMTRAERFATLNKTIICYRQREGSLSQAPKLKSLTDNILLLETWISRLRKVNNAGEDVSGFESVLARYYGNMLILRSRLLDDKVKQYDERIKSLSFLLNHSVTKRAKIIRCAYALLGLQGTLRILRMIDNKHKVN